MKTIKRRKTVHLVNKLTMPTKFKSRVYQTSLPFAHGCKYLVMSLGEFCLASLALPYGRIYSDGCDMPDIRIYDNGKYVGSIVSLYSTPPLF